eukprot:scaffold70427_cov57-Phaeocystis_antarctica.AAC.1
MPQTNPHTIQVTLPLPMWPLGTVPARLLCLLRARLAALGGSVVPGRGRPSGRPATASGARAAACIAADSTAFDHSGDR